MKHHLLKFFKKAMLLSTITILQIFAYGQTKTASVTLNKNVTYQKITGFGGFVNSPQFGYGFMSSDEINTVWNTSATGYNIMRIYIPIGDTTLSLSIAAWSQALSTAQLAKSLGLKVFATPWSMPAAWKTKNTINAVDSTGASASLAPAHYADYANYLNNFVVYMRTNGVELDAISIQNEPNEQATYAGCIWSPAQIATFLKQNAPVISCKVMAAESVGISDDYVNAMTADTAVMNHLGIYAGHQYGGISTTAVQNMQAKGKEVWMTEFLLNWNSGTTRNFSWGTDAFTFANAVNLAMVDNVNAWVHYAAKRYYGMIGDGTNGTTLGVITKRGNILTQFAKYITGATRIQHTWSDTTNVLNGSSYLSASGDSVIVEVINSSNNNYRLTVNLPFLTLHGRSVTTTATTSLVETDTVLATESARLKVNISPSSVTTLIYVKSHDLVPSQMTSQVVNYDTIESQTPTNPLFGTAYKLSGKSSVIFKSGTPLISANTTLSNGYLALNKKFNRLVFHVATISSASGYTSANTTLYYVNSAGTVNSHNYGTVNLTASGNFDMVFDISPNVLTDGCQGILSLTNGNFTSILTIQFGNVYFAIGNEKGYRFSGVYSGYDSHLLDALDDATNTTMDFTGVTGIPAGTNWNAVAANKNCIYYVQSGAAVASQPNVIAGTNSQTLKLVDGAGDFYSPTNFTATNASYQATINGYKMLVLPFDATIPTGVSAFNLQYSNNTLLVGNLIYTSTIPANTPVLVTGNGTFTFLGSGNVTPMPNLVSGIANGIYIGINMPIGSYYLNVNNGTASFSRSTTTVRPISSFDAYLSLGASVTAASIPLKLPIVPIAFTGCPNVNLIVARPGYNSYNNEPLSMYNLDTATGAATLIPGGPVKDQSTNVNIDLNGIGLNAQDGFVYGIRDSINTARTAQTAILYRVGSNYGSYTLGTLPAPALSGVENLAVVNPSAGTFDDQGNYYYIGMAGVYASNAFTPSSYYVGKLANVAALIGGTGQLVATWTKINLDNAPASYKTSIYTTITSTSGSGAGTSFQDITYSNLYRSLYVYAAYNTGSGLCGSVDWH